MKRENTYTFKISRFLSGDYKHYCLLANTTEGLRHSSIINMEAVHSSEHPYLSHNYKTPHLRRQ
jgi:hypothetical protein